MTIVQFVVTRCVEHELVFQTPSFFEDMDSFRHFILITGHGPGLGISNVDKNIAVLSHLSY
jgi:hypothetical protein